ncbi:Cation channel sperm-associated protein 2 [Dinochytrium kinnereticum]|nr:Cation channel sperm-associated protein 2 [Dinochytrium kinnereticum]
MTYISMLVIVVAYIYAVIGIYLYKSWTLATSDKLLYKDSFQDIGSAFKTLFALLTFDQWDPLNREAAQFTDPVWSQLYILSWVWLGAYIFRNIFVGVMVNNFDKISENLKEEKNETAKLKRFEKLRRKLNKELAIGAQLQKSLKDQDILQSIQKLLVASHGMSRGWEATVGETLAGLASSQSETMWPRDTLFKYLQLMENLQENMKEYEELQLLASCALLEIHDT